LDHLAYANDPFENGAAHPLDFGHWAAYKLELLTHSRVGHGDAVAIGIALDVVYSRRVGLLDAASAERILALIERLGFPVFADELMNTKGHNRLAILNGLDEFREQFGCELTIPLLCAIGTSVELASMERDQVAAAIVELRERARR
jgi:3-dehydroquinate synthase